MNAGAGEGEFSLLVANSPRAYGLVNPLRSLPYDTNGDGVLDSLDLSLVVDWLQTARSHSVSDIAYKHEVTDRDRAVEELGLELERELLHRS